MSGSPIGTTPSFFNFVSFRRCADGLAGASSAKGAAGTTGTGFTAVAGGVVSGSVSGMRMLGLASGAMSALRPNDLAGTLPCKRAKVILMRRLPGA